VFSLRVYVGSSLADADILATINRFVTDNAARQASFSAGECESLAYATGSAPLCATEPPSAFHDILIGHQGIYPATPGWDHTTGRGTPDISALVTVG